MNDSDDRNLAIDLALIDVTGHASLVAFLAAHTIAPARRLFHMPMPEPGEDTARLDRARHEYAVSGESFYGLEVSTKLFDRFIGPFVLFSQLFPGTLRDERSMETVLNVPQWAYFEDALELAHYLWSDLEILVAGLFGGSTEPVWHPGLANGYRPRGNNNGVGELWDARELARKALRPLVESTDPTYCRHSIGLRTLGAETTWDIDSVLRANVHQRLIWFAAQDLAFPIAQVSIDGGSVEPPEDPETPILLTDDHGVFATVVPETIAGVVALDLLSTFGRERQVGRCGHCGGWMLVSRSQAAHAARGGDIYHAECREAHRLAYFRGKSRDRYSRLKSQTNV